MGGNIYQLDLVVRLLAPTETRAVSESISEPKPYGEYLGHFGCALLRRSSI